MVATLVLAAGSALGAPSSPSCPKAVSLYAMQKTGSSFLASFLKDVARRQQMCKVYQYIKEFVCEGTMYIDCPRSSAQHRKSVALQREFAVPLASGRASCDAAKRRELFGDTNAWLRSRAPGDATKGGTANRHNLSVAALLGGSGFIRGPLRQLYTEYDVHAVPAFGSFHNVIVVHTRHPVEMMVSAYFCIADPKVCPVRKKHLGSHVPKNDTIASLDEFVLAGLDRPGATPHTIMSRSRRVAQFMTDFRARGRAALDGGSGSGDGGGLLGVVPPDGCPAAEVVHSQYEIMVSDFAGWLRVVLAKMASSPAKAHGMHALMMERYNSSFVPDGKHKHAVHKGANIAKLKPETVRKLVAHKGLAELLRDLNYDWLGHAP